MYRVVASIIPNMYEAPSIADFLRDKENIEFTDGLFPTRLYFRGVATITFPWLNFRYKPSLSTRGIVTDLNGTLEVGISDPELWLRKGEPEIFYDKEKRIYEPMVVYLRRKNRKLLVLASFKLHGPEEPEQDTETLWDRLRIPAHI